MNQPTLDDRRIGLTVRPRTVLVCAVAVASFFFVADVVIAFAVDAGADRTALLPWLLDTDVEANLPTWYSTVLLAAASLAMFVRAKECRQAGAPWGRHWAGLGAILLLLSVDEAAVLHENTAGPIERAVEGFGLGGDVARLAAVGVVVVVLLVLAVPFVHWLRALPRAARLGMLAGGALLVGSALGMETIARLLEQWRGFYGLADDLLSGVEEFGEMLGSTAFLVAALAMSGTPVPSPPSDGRGGKTGPPGAFLRPGGRRTLRAALRA